MEPIAPLEIWKWWGSPSCWSGVQLLRVYHTVSSSQDPSGNCIIQNLCKKEWMGLGVHSVPLENLHKRIHSSWMLNPPVKSPCQSIWSGFWDSIRAEMASSWLQHLSQIPWGHQSLQQLHCLQGKPVKSHGGISSLYCASCRFFLGKGWSKPMGFGIQCFYPNNNCSALPKWR